MDRLNLIYGSSNHVICSSTFVFSHSMASRIFGCRPLLTHSEHMYWNTHNFSLFCPLVLTRISHVPLLPSLPNSLSYKTTSHLQTPTINFGPFGHLSFFFFFSFHLYLLCLINPMSNTLKLI